MSIRLTVQAGNETICTRSVDVSDPSSAEIGQIIEDLVDTMRANDLVGMAAPQIGENIRIFVTEIRETPTRKKVTDPLKIFINPRIAEMSGEKIEDYEGCGSVANAQFFAPVLRADEVLVHAVNQKGQEFEVKATGLLAKIIQHEVDHLEGILFVEKISNPRKVMSREEYIKMRTLELTP